MNNNASEAVLYIVLIVVAALGFGIYVIVTTPGLADACFLPLAIGIGLGLVAWGVQAALGEIKALLDWWTNRQMVQDLHRVTMAKAQLDLSLVQPDANGMLPVARQLLESGALTNQILLLAAQHVANHAPVQPVPTSISYEPHLISKNDVRAEAGAQLPALPVTQPKSFLELFNAGSLPKDRFLMGYDLESGETVTATWKDLYSALIGGQSGAGKSTLIRNILSQSALQGGRFVVLDPHYNSGDESLGHSLSPLRPLTLCDVAHNDKTMADALQFVRSIGERRLHGQDTDKTPLVLMVDETTALLSRGAIKDQLLDVLGLIAQETSKVGVFALAIGQNFHSEIFDTTARNSFASMLSCRARKDVARVQSGNSEFATIAESPTIGQAVLMQPSGNVTKIAVPNCTQDMNSCSKDHRKTDQNTASNASGGRVSSNVSSVIGSAGQRRPRRMDRSGTGNDGRPSGAGDSNVCQWRNHDRNNCRRLGHYGQRPRMAKSQYRAKRYPSQSPCPSTVKQSDLGCNRRLVAP